MFASPRLSLTPPPSPSFPAGSARRRPLLPFPVLLPALLLLLLLAAAACTPPPETRVVRLADLLPVVGGDATLLAEDVALGEEPVVVADDLRAAHLGRLELTVEGAATRAILDWRLVGEPRFEAYRRLSIPLEGDGTRHTIDVDLGRTASWVGRVEALRLAAVEGGAARLVELRAFGSDRPERDIALDGLTLASLPALERREIPLDALDATGRLLPRRARFQVSVGLVPELDRPGVRGRFLARLLHAGGETVVLDETVEGGSGAARWRRHERVVELPPGARIELAFEGADGERPLPEGSGFWGAPQLLVDGRAPGPSLLLITIDTLRADRLGAYGSERGLTPRLDALAEESLLLADLHAPAPWTLPSVASLMTSQPPQVHGAGVKVGAFAPTALPEAATTLAEVLAAEGFVTRGVYHNIYINPAFRLHQGFDHWHSIEERDAVLVDRAIAELENLGDQRFFVYLHLFDPHNPYEPTPEDCERVLAGLAPEVERGEDECAVDRRPGAPLAPRSQWPWIEALYDAEVAGTDREVGRLLDALEELGRSDDTVVAVVSDHGEDFYEHLVRMRALGYRAVSDHGHSQYQELLEVPGMIRVPGRPGARLDDPTELVDVVPTVLAALGLDDGGAAAPEGWRESLTGENLLALVDAGRRPSRRTLIGDNILHGPARWSVRRGPWKLVEPDRERWRGKPLAPELYDLANDPGEVTNLLAPDGRLLVEALRAAGHTPEEVARILEELRSLGEAERARRFARALGDGEASTYLEWSHITRLRALGYLQ